MKKIFIFALALAAFGMSGADRALAAVEGATQGSPALSAERVESALKSLKLRNPDRYQYIVGMREKEPEKFSHMILATVHEQDRLERMKKEFPENYRLQEAMWRNREKLRGLVQEYNADEDGAGKKIIESQIENLLGEQYDLRSQMKANRLKRVEQRLTQMKQGLREDSLGKKQKFVSEWKPKLLTKPSKKTE